MPRKNLRKPRNEFILPNSGSFINLWQTGAKQPREEEPLEEVFRGDATARLALAIKGIEESDLQEMTDKLYSDYVAKLEGAGFEIISPDEAGEN